MPRKNAEPPTLATIIADLLLLAEQERVPLRLYYDEHQGIVVRQTPGALLDEMIEARARVRDERITAAEEAEQKAKNAKEAEAKEAKKGPTKPSKVKKSTKAPAKKSTAKPTPPTPKPSKASKVPTLEEKRETIVTLCKLQGFIKATDVHDLFGVGKSASNRAGQVLGDMVREGILERHGRSRGTTYSLAVKVEEKPKAKQPKKPILRPQPVVQVGVSPDQAPVSPRLEGNLEDLGTLFDIDLVDDTGAGVK